MNEELIKTKILNLRKQLHRWNDEYFNQQKPSVSDQVYDAALLELIQLEKAYPKVAKVLQSITSPTAVVGGAVDPRFQKHLHKIPMLSLNKAYSFNDLERFVDNIDKKFSNFSFYCEPKIDGLSIALHYDHGKLVLALTRGNGTIGEDVTHNVLEIPQIPQKIAYLAPLEVRGEIYLDKADFEKINANLAANDQPLYANARNLASGTMRQLDSQIVKQRKLSAFFYTVVNPELHQLKLYSSTIQFLKKHNFPVNDYGKKVANINEAFTYINALNELKEQWGYDVDGFVIKLEELAYYPALGVTSKFPHHAIAYKFASEIIETKLLAIFPTVGRTGVITYNAVLEPVLIGGTIVTAATLHNYTYIEKLRISIGDFVVIKKAGEIIPKVLYPLHPQTITNYPKVLNCPSCHANLQLSPSAIDQFCVNQNCPEVNLKKMVFFASRKGINIEGLAESQIRLFVEKGFLKSIPDLLKLKDHQMAIEQLHGFRKLSVNKLIKAIEQSKNLYLYQLITALGINNVGEKTAKFLAQKIPDLKLFPNFNFEELLAYQDIGPITVASLQKYFTNPQNLQFWHEIMMINWNFKSLETPWYQHLIGTNFVITGTLSRPRKIIEVLIEAAGGKLINAISKTTNYLIVGTKPSSKLVKAQQWKIPILTEDQLLALLNQQK